jgi:hypothetical protein
MQNSQKNTGSNDEDNRSGYSPEEALERLATKGNIEAIKMLQELQKEKALDEVIKEKFGLLKPKTP